MAFITVLGAVLGGPTKLSEINNTFNNTKHNRDLILGDNALGTGESGHFHDFSETISEGVSSTTVGTPQQKVLHTFTPQQAGDYIILYQAEITNSSTNGRVEMQVDFDAGTQLAETHIAPDTAEEYYLMSGQNVQALTVAAHTIEIDFFRPGAVGTARIRRARVQTWRVG
jgi:hypothetical protein